MNNAIATHATGPAWSPFRHRAYAVIWTTTVFANIGTWMYSAAAGWPMTDLSVDSLMVSLVERHTAGNAGSQRHA